MSVELLQPRLLRRSPFAGERLQARTAVGLAAALLLAVLASFHVGFQASDDASYLTGALGWLHGFPYVGVDHWTLRHTVTLPTALSVRLLGLNEFAVSLPSMAYFVAFVAVNGWFTCRYLGDGAALVASLLAILAPGFAVVATYLNPDIAELFFASSAFWMLRLALDDGRRLGRWTLAGVLAGLAFMTRQTSLALLVFVFVLAVVRPGVDRSRYVVLGFVALAVLACEWLYLTAMTGNPLYRWSVDFNHDAVNRFAEAERVARSGALIDKEGIISVNVFLDPVLNLLVSQKYGLLFWLLIPAAFAAWRRRREPAGRTLALVAAYGLISFLFVAANPKLYLVPRYFIVTAWCAMLVVAWWIGLLWREHRRGLAVALTGAAALASVLSLAVENTDPRFAERQLVRWVMAHPGEPVYTDIETRARAEYFLRFAGLSTGSVNTDAPPAGARFLYSRERVEQCAATARCRARAVAYRPGAGWREEQIVIGPRKPIAALADALGLARILPPDVARRVDAPIGRVVVYRVR